MFYRAFYRPANGSFREEHVDATDPSQLPAGAILVVKINEDGTREIVRDENQRRSLTPKESQYYKFAQRHLEFKHDGGDTPEMRLLRREHKD